jgi:hypothetical protein
MCPPASAPAPRRSKTEALKNLIVNRFHLNFKDQVGATSAAIREAHPHSRREWEEYYYRHIRTRPQLRALGQEMYRKIRTDLIPALLAISEVECCQYLHELVIHRTFEGYVAEVEMVRKLLEGLLAGVRIEPAPDEWDRRLAVDFYLRAGHHLIGLQIKPISVEHLPQLQLWERIWKTGHEEFTRRYGGRVFTAYHLTRGTLKELHNPEVVEEITQEIDRLTDQCQEHKHRRVPTGPD